MSQLSSLRFTILIRNCKQNHLHYFSHQIIGKFTVKSVPIAGDVAQRYSGVTWRHGICELRNSQLQTPSDTPHPPYPLHLPTLNPLPRFEQSQSRHLTPLCHGFLWATGVAKTTTSQNPQKNSTT